MIAAAKRFPQVRRLLDDARAAIPELDGLDDAEVYRYIEKFSSLQLESGAIPMPTGLGRFFYGPSTAQVGYVHLPRMELTVADALKVRAGEQVFDAFRNAVSSISQEAGAARPGEPGEDYALRLRAIAERVLPPVDEELRSIESRGKLFGLVPGAIAGSIRILSGVLDSMLPGTGLVGKGGAMMAQNASTKLLKDPTTNGVAATTALRYSANLQLTGYL
jgi:hypothetical protein